jgi:hypothetical protein
MPGFTITPCQPAVSAWDSRVPLGAGKGLAAIEQPLAGVLGV